MFKKSIAQLKQHSNENYQSVRRLLIILTGSVFIIELVVMNALDWLPPRPQSISDLLDATVLSALLFPVFYYLIFRPLIQNIAERKQVEEDLRVAAVAFEIKDPMLITDVDANIVRVNQLLLEKTGYSEEELIGQNPRIFKSGMHDKKFYERLWKQLLQTGSWCGEIRIKTKEGRILHPFWLTITAVKNEQQEITHYIGIYNF